MPTTPAYFAQEALFENAHPWHERHPAAHGNVGIPTLMQSANQSPTKVNNVHPPTPRNKTGFQQQSQTSVLRQNYPTPRQNVWVNHAHQNDAKTSYAQNAHLAWYR